MKGKRSDKRITRGDKIAVYIPLDATEGAIEYINARKISTAVMAAVEYYVKNTGEEETELEKLRKEVEQLRKEINKNG